MASPNENPAAHNPAIVKIVILPIFRIAIVSDDFYINSSPDILIIKATIMSNTANTDIRKVSSPTSNNCRVYVPKVRTTGLSFIIIEKAIRRAVDAVIAPLP
jgi:hypothetical protein